MEPLPLPLPAFVDDWETNLGLLFLDSSSSSLLRPRPQAILDTCASAFDPFLKA